jgi:hypothetical protein
MEKIVIPKLKGKSNWSIWKLQIESSLQYHDYEGVLTGGISEPAALAADATNQQRKEHEAAQKLYKKANGFAVSLVSTTVEEGPLQLILMYKTVREMWQKLTASYEQKSEQRLEHLYLQLLEYKKDIADSIATHISKLQRLWIELNEESMRVDRRDLPPTLLLMRILSTLPEEYFEFRTTWESVPRDQRNVEYLLERLTMVEIRISQKQAESSTSAALFAKGSVNKEYSAASKKKLKPKKDLSKIKCYNCHEQGHYKNKCPNAKKDDNKACDKSHKAEALFGVALVSDEISESAMWISDTGASHHMTKSSEFFVTYKSFDAPKPIVVGNKRTMLAYGCGNIRIEALTGGVWREHYLSDVWYTPDVVKNLFSVSAAADKGFTYRLDKNCCELIKDDKVIVSGERHQGLYKLHIRPIVPEVAAEVLVAHKVETLQVWHERLCHQNKRYVEKFLKSRDIEYVKESDNQICEGCMQGKFHRLSFGTRPNICEKPGDLIHADVCGPMQENSFQGYRYFVTFKDEFTKYRTVYFLKKKSEVPEKLKVFLAEARTLGHTVKELLTDGGGEFDNKQMHEITQEVGLYHRITMPYTAEQNGSAERENRTLMEAARSMLLSTQLPNKLWAEAVNTAAYVLNRTGPTKVNDASPYELWTGKKAPIDHVKVFGTECFVHVPQVKRQKLDAKAEKGILVGYCDNKDGYRIYLPTKNDVIRSRDVIFMEECTKITNDNVSEVTMSEQSVSSISLNEAEDDTDAEGARRSLRDRSQLRQPARLEDFAMFAMCNEPATYVDAMQSCDREKWQKVCSPSSTLVELNK